MAYNGDFQLVKILNIWSDRREAIWKFLEAMDLKTWKIDGGVRGQNNEQISI